MQFFDRADEPPPACLSDERAQEARAILRDIFRRNERVSSQTRISMRPYMVEAEELDAALGRLFERRCAFCEAEDRLRAYRFRPGEEAGPSEAAPPDNAERSHLYYSWLINAWQNIYHICQGCTPTETSIFPVVGRRCPLPSNDEVELYANEPIGSWRGEIAERPFLLDPCAHEDFRRHLAALPGGELIGTSRRGEFTIRHFNLNRPDLLARRLAAFETYLSALLAPPGRRRSGSSSAFAFAKMEFGGGWYLLLYQIALKLGGGGGVRPILSRKRIGQYYSERLSRTGIAKRIFDAFADLRDNPQQLLERQSRTARIGRSDARPVSFVFENFKALEYVEIALKAQADPVVASLDTLSAGDSGPTPAPAIAILGENAAGKSSILEAMALVLSEQDARNDLGLDASRLELNPLWMGGAADRPARDGRLLVRYETGDEAEVRIGSGLPFTTGAEISRIPVFAYGAFRLFTKADKRPRASSRIRSLFEPNYILPNPESWLDSIYGTPQFAEVARALKAILAIDQKVDVIEVDAATHEAALVVTIDRAGLPALTVRTPFAAVSSGFRAILAVACDVIRGLIAIQDKESASLARVRAVVLIDEIEAHLHPKWKIRIIHGLREALPNVTFIVTTHDPLCLRALAPEEVRAFRRVLRVEQGPTNLPIYVEQIEELPALGPLTIEQLLTSDLFQLHSTDAPALEDSFAKAGDLLAREQSGERLVGLDAASIEIARAELRRQIGGSLPIGSTDVERLVLEAIETYLSKRRGLPHKALASLRDDTRDRIIAALEGL